MATWLGKSNFSQGLTTKTRGVYGNIPVLNICHGYDISGGELSPINNVSAHDPNAPIVKYKEPDTQTDYWTDYVIKLGDGCYSYTDFLNEDWITGVTVKQFFDEPKLLSKPTVSDRLIIYPTNKGLFAYEPEAEGVIKVRYASFMSPEDYDEHNDESDTDYDDYHLSISLDSFTKQQIFIASTNSSDYDKSNATISTEAFDGGNTDDVLMIQLQPNISRSTGFSVTRKLPTAISGFSKGWFVYDMKIEGDTQDYMASTIFENGDATLSGYEIVFYKDNDNTVDEVKIGITKLEPLADKWFRCISYVELDNTKTYDRVKFCNANYYENKHDTKIYIGCHTFNNEDWKSWKQVGNYLFAGEKGRGSYAEQFKRSIDHSESFQTPENVIKDYDFSNINDGSETQWVVSNRYGDLETDVRIKSEAPPQQASYDTHTYTKCFTFEGKETIAEYYATVEPNCYYEFGCMMKHPSSKVTKVSVDRIERDGTKKNIIPFTIGTFISNSRWSELYWNGLGNKEIFSGQSNQFVISFMSPDWDNESGFTGVWLKKIKQLPFYKTTRVLYDYTKEDMLDEDYQVHNCCEFSYSFCGRNKLRTKAEHEGTVKDQFKLMISNASKETDKFADHPFACHIIELDTLPTKDIEGTERNVNDLYNDYWTDILLYKSVIYGQTEVQEDFSYIGRINKEQTAGDHRMTSTGFYFKDNDSEREDREREDYYDIDEWHAVDPEQEIYNDFLEQAQCCVHLNGRLFCGSIDTFDNWAKNGQPTGLAVSNYDENWIFPTSVDEGSIAGTGTQTDNLHNVSNRIVALATCKDRLFIFYDKEVIYLYGNDFYSNNGFGHTQVARLTINPKTIQNGVRDLYASDNKEFYHFGVQGEMHTISYNRVDTKTMDFHNASTMFWDNKYFIRCKQKSKGTLTNIIYVYDSNVNGWYTIDNQNIVQLIDDILNPTCLTWEIEDGDTVYRVVDMFGGDLSGSRVIETMYQIVNAGETGSNPAYDVDINDFAMELSCPADNENLDLKFYGQGEFIEEWIKPMPIDTKHFRYNKNVRFNRKVSAVKQRLEYKGSNPPTIYSLGVIRNDTKARE